MVRAGVGVYFYNAPISSHPGRVTLGDICKQASGFGEFSGADPGFFKEGVHSPLALLQNQ